MKPTQDYILEHFDLYNRTMFGGTLPILPVRLTNARTYMGMLTFRKRVGWFGRKQCSDFCLRISQRFDYSEQQLQDSLIHEMIHYYIAYHQLRDTSAHGSVFMQMMNDINRNFGRHITVSHRASREERVQLLGNQPRPRVFAIIAMSNGKYCIKVVPRIAQRVRTMHRRLTADPQVCSVAWYYSTDPFFALYPSSMGRRMQYINLDEARPHLSAATPLSVESLSL